MRCKHLVLLGDIALVVMMTYPDMITTYYLVMMATHHLVRMTTPTI